MNLPLFLILSSSTSVWPWGSFLVKTWAERRNIASTAEPFNNAIWSSWSRVWKPARKTRTWQMHVLLPHWCYSLRCLVNVVDNSFRQQLELETTTEIYSMLDILSKLEQCSNLGCFLWTQPALGRDWLPFLSTRGSFLQDCTAPVTVNCQTNVELAVLWHWLVTQH